MRILMWLTLGFGSVCALCAYGEGTLPLWLLLPAAACCFLGGKWKNLRRCAVFLLGCLLGLTWFGRYESSYLAAPAALDGQTQNISIRASDFGFDTAYGTAVDGRIRLDGKSYQVRTYLKESHTLNPGDTLTGPFLLRVNSSGKGVFAYQKGEVEMAAAEKREWRDFPARLRSRLLDILDSAFPKDTAPFAKALLLGYTRELDYETDTSFKVSGIRHVVAVSGLHVSILFALVSALTFHKRFLTALVGFPALLLFAAVAGFTPSVTRACIMAGLMLLALLLNREYDGPTALSFAALVMLLIDPLVITDIGFQLSVASVAGIYLFGSSIYHWLYPRLMGGGKKPLLARWISASVSISLSALILTAPLCAWHFGTVSLIGVLTNLLTLWLISGIFYGLMAVCLLSLIWQGAAAALAWLLSWPIRYILLIANLFAKFPLAAVYTASPYIVCWLVFVYILLAVFLLQKEKRPGILGCCAALGLFLALTASYVEPMTDDTRFTALDVGQGQCILIQNGGKTCMVDCGGGSDARTADLAAETLLSQGIFRLDALILTHLDRDHAGAAANLLSRVPADTVIAPPVPGDLKIPGVYVTQTLELGWKGAKFTVFPPPYPGIGNENSLSVLFDSEKCDILITGDRDAFGERQLLRYGNLSHVNILVAGHHGSKNSTCQELLSALTPEIVVISAGKDNPYGHPAPELLERLRKYGCEVYRTDQNGTIFIRR